MSTIIIQITQCFNAGMSFDDTMDEIGFARSSPAVREVFRNYWRLLGQEAAFKCCTRIDYKLDEVSP